MLEKTVFLICEPCGGYSYVGICKFIRSRSSLMHYYVVVLKHLAKFTGTHLHRSLFLTCNFNFIRRDIGTYSFLSVLRNFLGTLLSWKSSGKLILKGECYKKWWTDILIIIKIYREVDSFFKKTEIARESVYLRIYIYLRSVSKRSSQWRCLCKFH